MVFFPDVNKYSAFGNSRKRFLCGEMTDTLADNAQFRKKDLPFCYFANTRNIY